jgi:short-subunit dehydrogenase
MKTRSNLFTLITGASTGLGKELAIECARRKMNLILVSLPDENLAELCAHLSARFGIVACPYETDLTDKEQVERLAAWVVSNFSVNVLINNAGAGGTRLLETTPTDYIDRIIQLNIRATSLLVRLLIPELKMHQKAYILNVSSMAAFSPLPYKTVYPASKAFVYHFTRGLKAELRDTNIKVSVVNPGPIMTNPDVVARIQKQGALGRLALIPASAIARISVSELIRGKAVIIPGYLNRVNVMLMGLIPSGIKLAMSSRIIQRELQ